MKVLNHKEIGEWKKTIKCKCGAELEVLADDFQDGYFGSDYTERGQLRYFVACARCRDNIHFLPHELPSVVRETINAKKEKQSDDSAS